MERACAALSDGFAGACAASAAAARVAAPDLRLATGLALAPSAAARCLLDARRTRAFLRGTWNALREAQRRFAPSPVEALYAGTGPFAPLALLAMPWLDPAKVRFTLLDVHEASVRSVEALVEVAGATPFVRDVVRADATAYRHPAPLHVVISETMQRSLREEPFVAILRNLRPQLAPGALVVPERVSVELALLDPEAERCRWRGEPATGEPERRRLVFRVDAGGEFPGAGDEPRTLTVRRERSGAAPWVALLTRILLPGGEILEPYASGLTMPEILWPLSPLQRDTTIEFRYEAGAYPQIVWQASADPVGRVRTARPPRNTSPPSRVETAGPLPYESA